MSLKHVPSSAKLQGESADLAHELDLQITPYRVPVLHRSCPANKTCKGIVILLHGFPDTRHTWRATLDYLAEQGYDCYAPCMPGYAESYQLIQDRYHFEALAAELDRVITAIAGERKVHLVAHDWGAAVAYWYGLLFPQRLRSVTTLAVPPIQRLFKQMAKRPWMFARSFYQLRFQFSGYAQRLLRRDDWAYLRRLWALWSPGWVAGEHIETAIADMTPAAVTRASLLYYPHAFRWFDAAWYRLICEPTRYTVPWLILHGDQDGVYGPKVFRHCVRAEDFSAGLRCHLIEGAGHFLHLEHPDVIHHHLLGFLDGQPA